MNNLKIWSHGVATCYTDTTNSLNHKPPPKREGKQNFKWTSTSKTKLKSRAAYMVANREHQVIFLTLTYSAKNFNKTQTECNQDLSRFLKSMKKTYQMKSYLWVLELTKQGIPHYHCLIEFPYHPIKKINQTWKAAINGIGSVQLPKEHKSLVNNASHIINYFCKYITKSINQEYTARHWGNSCNLKNNTLTLPYNSIRYDTQMSINIYGKLLADRIESAHNFVVNMRSIKKEYTTTYFCNKGQIAEHVKKLIALQNKTAIDGNKILCS
jgi:hypothetical protein